MLTSHLDPYDLEDLIYVWMQMKRDYLAFPRTRLHDTPAYEWSMIHRHTRRRGIVQIKTGATPVNLPALVAATTDDVTDTFAYATSGDYHGDHGLVTEVIRDNDLLAFVERYPDLLPARIRGWFDLATASTH